MSRVWVLVFAAFAGLCALAYVLFASVPTGFVPEEDQGYVLGIAAAARGRDHRAHQGGRGRRCGEIAMKTPGVADVLEISGYNVVDAVKQPFQGVAFIILDPFEERKTPETQAAGHHGAAARRVRRRSPRRASLVANAPAIPGLGSTGGFTYEIQDLDAQGVDALAEGGRELHRAGAQATGAGRRLHHVQPATCRNAISTSTASRPRRAASR